MEQNEDILANKKMAPIFFTKFFSFLFTLTIFFYLVNKINIIQILKVQYIICDHKDLCSFLQLFSFLHATFYCNFYQLQGVPKNVFTL